MAKDENSNSMFEEFVKWMAALPKEERDQKLYTLEDLFAPSRTHADFARLKAALARRDAKIKKLIADNKALAKPTFERLYKSICRNPQLQKEICTRIMAAELYRKLNNLCAEFSYENYLLEQENKQLKEQLRQLVARDNKE